MNPEVFKLLQQNGPCFSGPTEASWKNYPHVKYNPSHNCGGTVYAIYVVEYLKRRFPGKKFANVLDMASGPGFIGFALLAEGIAERVVMADVVESMKDNIEKVCRENGLENRVQFYASNGLKNIPESEMFDLVVCLPPWRYSKPYINHALLILPVFDENMSLHMDRNGPETGGFLYDVGHAFLGKFFHQIPKFMAPNAHLQVIYLSPLEDVWKMHPEDVGIKLPFAPIFTLKNFGDYSGLFLEEVVHLPDSPQFLWNILFKKSTVDTKKSLIV